MSDCIRFEGTIDTNGYGRKRVGGKLYMAHRLAYEESFGEIPAEKVVDHTCFNRACVNPEHLRILSRADNARFHNPNCSCSRCRPELYKGKIQFCAHGHDKDSSGRTASGQCLLCHREITRNYMRKVRSGVAKVSTD